jgi:hypothetical protein
VTQADPSKTQANPDTDKNAAVPGQPASGAAPAAPSPVKKKLTHTEKKAARRATKAAKRAARDPHARLFPKPTRKQSITMIVIVCVLAAISYYVRLAPGTTDDSLDTSIDTAQTAEKTDESAASASTETDAASDKTTIYAAGTYTAGKDIPAGQYKFLATDGEATIEVGSSTMVFTASYWVDLADGQSMTVTGATFVSGDAISPVNAETLASGGLYRVGVDCPAGVYVCTTTAGIQSSSVVAYATDAPDKAQLSEVAVEAGTDVTFAPDTYVWLGGCDAVYGKE